MGNAWQRIKNCHKKEVRILMIGKLVVGGRGQGRIQGGGWGRGGGLRGLKPPLQVTRCVAYILAKTSLKFHPILEKINEHAKTSLHKSEHEERQISRPETYNVSS